MVTLIKLFIVNYRSLLRKRWIRRIANRQQMLFSISEFSIYLYFFPNKKEILTFVCLMWFAVKWFPFKGPPRVINAGIFYCTLLGMPWPAALGGGQQGPLCILGNLGCPICQQGSTPGALMASLSRLSTNTDICHHPDQPISPI